VFEEGRHMALAHEPLPSSKGHSQA